MSNAQDTADGWIDHDGGPCPVERSEDVHVKYNNGHSFDLTAFPASIINWRNVAHYRVVKP